jgi:16S rRNA processing protein RimM
LSSQPQRWVAIARILRTRGNKGEVAAELLTDFPERLAKLAEVFLRAGDGRDDTSEGEPRRIGLASFWMDRNHPGQGVFRFEGCASISDAEKFRGMDVLLPIEQRVSLPAGHYFVTDLIGCSVFESPACPAALSSSPCSMETAPAHLGIVKDVQFTGESVAGTPFLAVDTHQGEVLIPLAQDICERIDIPARRIDVVLPEGLRDLNASGEPIS